MNDLSPPTQPGPQPDPAPATAWGPATNQGSGPQLGPPNPPTTMDPLLGPPTADGAVGVLEPNIPGQNEPSVPPPASAPDPDSIDASIVAVGLRKTYGQLQAVDGIELVVPHGAIYGLIGPNGAGKSTFMSMAASLLLPTAGAIRVEGSDPVAKPAAVRAKVGYMPDGLGVYDGLSVSEYIEFFAAAHRVPRDEWAGLTDGLLELVELDVKRDASVNSLSRGMKQRLSLARALVHDPSLLILDEPASGLDPRARIELRHLMTNLNAMGKTILVSSHILTELQEVCTHVGIMEAGRLLASGSPAEILERTRTAQQVKVSFEDGTSDTITLPEGMTMADLLRYLVNEDPREVVGFAPTEGGLEDVFLTVTEGIVQ